MRVTEWAIKCLEEIQSAGRDGGAAGGPAAAAPSLDAREQELQRRFA